MLIKKKKRADVIINIRRLSFDTDEKPLQAFSLHQPAPTCKDWSTSNNRSVHFQNKLLSDFILLVLEKKYRIITISLQIKQNINSSTVAQYQMTRGLALVHKPGVEDPWFI